MGCRILIAQYNQPPICQSCPHRFLALESQLSYAAAVEAIESCVELGMESCIVVYVEMSIPRPHVFVDPNCRIGCSALHVYVPRLRHQLLLTPHQYKRQQAHRS